MKAGDFPIYKSLVDEDTEYVLEPKRDSTIRGYLYKIITPTRISVVDWYTSAETNSQKSVKFAIEKSTNVYHHISNDPVILAHAAFITVCGLGGVVLGSRGGVLRQAAYATLGAGVGTTMCYPTCTLKAANYAWDVSASKVIEVAEKAKRR